MKIIIFFTTLLLFSVASFSQQTTTATQSLTKTDYLQKSKNQKTTALILLGIGTAAIITGILIESPHRGTGNTQSFSGGLIEVGGIICVLTSIPYFLSSSKNKKRSTTLGIYNQRILLPQNNSFVLKNRPSFSVRIPLN